MTVFRFLLPLLAFALCTCAVRTPERAAVTLTLAAINDFHGNLERPAGGVPEVDDATQKLTRTAAGGVARLATIIERLRAQNTYFVFVSAGDLVGASPLASGYFDDEPTIEAMNSLKLDLNGVGNHEFDRGRDELLRLQSGGWRQLVVIDNRPGIIANSAVAKATPDGHTLLFVSGSIAVRAVMFTNLPYDTLKDFAGVTELGTGNSVLIVAPTLGVNSVKELVAYTQARPGKIFFASPVAGGMDHMNAERFRLAAGIKAQHVSYKGSGESAIEVAAGRAHFTVVSVMVAQSLVKDGKVVALLQRHPVLPGVPLIADVVPEWTLVGANAVLAPAGTPLPIRRQIGKEIAHVLNLPDIKERLESVAFHVATTTPEEHERRLRVDIAAFAKVMKEIGLKPN